ncbi:MAG: hypothetical protein COU69_03070 [Candidatus Pacebacteria bacterium CG10_big_fil_rev_8_21_14_0_10_56_10]|nr:MAG: hypothetical protein COU69_03070 [Candidatus Pacebacteria bacterium CG10_big_fil_rev_8_21_14_0_10_56_10]
MQQQLELVGAASQTIGEITVAYTALSVHYRVRHEHKINSSVFREMRREHVLGMVGVVLLLAGFMLDQWQLITAALGPKLGL